MSSQEVWKDIPLHPKYEICLSGKVRNKTTKRVIKHTLDTHGYCVFVYTLMVDGGRKTINVTIHSALITAFVGPRGNGMAVDHIDRNKTNNNLSNLRYVTVRQNNQNKNNSSKYGSGVCINGNKFQSKIKTKGKVTCLGTYFCPIMASEKYWRAVKETKE